MENARGPLSVDYDGYTPCKCPRCGSTLREAGRSGGLMPFALICWDGCGWGGIRSSRPESASGDPGNPAPEPQKD